MNHALPLVSSADIEAAKALIASENLHYEEGWDKLVGVFEQRKLIGCGARQGRVLKMLVIDAGYRGGDVLGEIVTELINCDRQMRAGGHFILTKPCAIPSFERFNFRLLVRHPGTGTGLLESCNGIKQFFRQHATSLHSGRNGAVVFNADPFPGDIST